MEKSRKVGKAGDEASQRLTICVRKPWLAGLLAGLLVLLTMSAIVVVFYFRNMRQEKEYIETNFADLAELRASEVTTEFRHYLERQTIVASSVASLPGLLSNLTDSAERVEAAVQLVRAGRVTTATMLHQLEFADHGAHQGFADGELVGLVAGGDQLNYSDALEYLQGVNRPGSGPNYPAALQEEDEHDGVPHELFPRQYHALGISNLILPQHFSVGMDMMTDPLRRVPMMSAYGANIVTFGPPREQVVTITTGAREVAYGLPFYAPIFSDGSVDGLARTLVIGERQYGTAVNTTRFPFSGWFTGFIRAPFILQDLKALRLGHHPIKWAVVDVTDQLFPHDNITSTGIIDPCVIPSDPDQLRRLTEWSGPNSSDALFPFGEPPVGPQNLVCHRTQPEDGTADSVLPGTPDHLVSMRFRHMSTPLTEGDLEAVLSLTTVEKGELVISLDDGHPNETFNPSLGDFVARLNEARSNPNHFVREHAMVVGTRIWRMSVIADDDFVNATSLSTALSTGLALESVITLVLALGAGIFVGTMQDLRLRRHKLRQAQVQALESLSKSQLSTLTFLAHEMRNPLQGVMTGLELLMTDGDQAGGMESALSSPTRANTDPIPGSSSRSEGRPTESFGPSGSPPAEGEKAERGRSRRLSLPDAAAASSSTSRPPRAPISATTGSSNRLRTPAAATARSRASQGQSAIVAHCIDGARTLQRLVDDIRDKHQLLEGRLSYQYEAVEATSWLRSMLNVSLQVPLHYRFDANLPRMIVMDTSRVARMVRYWLDFTAKYTVRGSIRVRASMFRRQEALESSSPAAAAVPESDIRRLQSTWFVVVIEDSGASLGNRNAEELLRSLPAAQLQHLQRGNPGSCPPVSGMHCNPLDNTQAVDSASDTWDPISRVQLGRMPSSLGQASTTTTARAAAGAGGVTVDSALQGIRDIQQREQDPYALPEYRARAEGCALTLDYIRELAESLGGSVSLDHQDPVAHKGGIFALAIPLVPPRELLERIPATSCAQLMRLLQQNAMPARPGQPPLEDPGLLANGRFTDEQAVLHAPGHVTGTFVPEPPSTPPLEWDCESSQESGSSGVDVPPRLHARPPRAEGFQPSDSPAPSLDPAPISHRSGSQGASDGAAVGPGSVAVSVARDIEEAVSDQRGSGGGAAGPVVVEAAGRNGASHPNDGPSAATPASASSAAAAGAAPAPAAGPSLAPVRSSVSGMRVLLVDDDSTIRTLVGMMLRRLRCKVEVCEDGKLVAGVLERRGILQPQGGGPAADGDDRPVEPLDLILMDIVMPESDGATVTKDLVVDRGLKVPIVAATSSANRWDLVRYRDSGFFGLLCKPYSQGSLRDKLQFVLSAATEPGLKDEELWQE